MKKTLQSISLLLVGLLLVSSCSEEKTGESVKQITENIDFSKDDILEDTTSIDTTDFEEPEVVKLVSPPPPPSDPIPPRPWPPEPEPPEPIPIPEPWPLPEPVPAPNPVVDFPDVEPVYPGDSRGDSKEMTQFISEHIQYPQIDKEMGNQGRVYLEFIVEKDGSLSNIKVLRGVSKSIDREAKRIVRLMPNWKPGESQGKIVRTKMRLPITFRLD